MAVQLSELGLRRVDVKRITGDGITVIAGPGHTDKAGTRVPAEPGERNLSPEARQWVEAIRTRGHSR